MPEIVIAQSWRLKKAHWSLGEIPLPRMGPRQVNQGMVCHQVRKTQCAVRRGVCWVTAGTSINYIFKLVQMIDGAVIFLQGARGLTVNKEPGYASQINSNLTNPLKFLYSKYHDLSAKMEKIDRYPQDLPIKGYPRKDRQVKERSVAVTWLG